MFKLFSFFGFLETKIKYFPFKKKLFKYKLPIVLLKVTICFEDVFPHGIAGHVTSEIDFLLGLANDGWFLESAAQWQHSANAVFRAVENGVGLVRTCNNGVTGWWDARGTRRSTLADTEGGVYSPGILIIAVPVGLPWVETPYHRYGDVFAGLCTALAGWRMIRAKWRL